MLDDIIQIIIFTSILTVIYSWIIKKLPASYNKKFLLNLFWTGVAIRILLAIFLHYSDLIYFFAGDSVTYESRGWGVTQYWKGSLSSLPRGVLYEGSEGFHTRVLYYYFHAAIYYFFGYRPILPQIFNCFLGAFMVFPMYRLTKNYFSEYSAKTTSKLVIFFPSLILWSSVNVRDIIIAILIVFIMLNISKMQKKVSGGSVISILFCAFLLLQIRPYILLFLVPPLVVNFIGVSKRTFFIFALFILGAFFIARNAGLDSWTEHVQAPFETIQDHRQAEGYGNTTYLGDVDLTKTEDLKKAIPVSLLYGVLAPFPWKLGSALQNFSAPEMLVYYYLLFFAIKGLWRARRDDLRHHAFIIVFLCTIVFVESLGVNNVGTAYRMRAQWLPFVFFYASYGLYLKRQEKIKKRKSQIPLARKG